jgi:ABC-type sugar transport system ATPase subunit
MELIEFRRIGKRFPGVRALDDVSFTVEEGSCHALIGENGAGKSTLGRILGGILRPDTGEIRLRGAPLRMGSPHEARRHGIAIVHQELAFCPDLTVAENLCMGDLPRSRWGWVDWRRLRARARAMLDEIEAHLDVSAPMGSLSTGAEQLVQVAAAVGTGARVIVMDEPTSSLSAAEADEIFRLVRALKRRGVTLVYVSHRLEELFALCDRITVLRDGRHVVTEPIAATYRDRVIMQMIGRELATASPRHLNREPGPVRLAVHGLASPGHFQDINLTVRAGEVVGLAGLVGAGRSAVAQAIFGLDHAASGRVEVDGRPLARRSTRAALAAGVGLVPEDRKREGLVLALNCRENAALAALPRVTRFGWVNAARESALVRTFTERFRVKAASLEVGISTLSGGNQQKIALAKWLACSCEVLLVDEPTRGIDVGAKSEIYEVLDALACEGKALLVISSELPELLAICRRILVMREGRLVGEVRREDFSEATVMRLMAGAS